MKNKKRKIFIDFRENFQKKTKLIEDLKVLISSDLNLKEKEDIFNSIRRKWITIGKVPSHLAFNLNNSYNHQVKLYYDLVYLDRNYKEKDLDKNLLEKKELIVKIKKLNDYGNKIKSYKDSLKIIKRWNFLTGPTRQNYERKLNEEFDQYVKKIKDSKKEYLNNKDKYVNTFIESKKSLAKEMESINEQNCSGKTSWIKKIKEFESLKQKFIDIGPVDHQGKR